MHNLTRITFNPEVMGGKPCIRGMRVTVGTIVGLVASGKTVDEVLADYPYLEREDILGSVVIRRLAGRRKGSAVGLVMKILIDMNLPPRWVQVFAKPAGRRCTGPRWVRPPPVTGKS